MITYDQVKSEVKFLTWQIAAWERVKKDPKASAIIHNLAITEIGYLQKRTKVLENWNNKRWEI